LDNKKILQEALKVIGALKENTEQIIINCNNGSVCDYKITERHK
jgi:hypothetical protein